MMERKRYCDECRNEGFPESVASPVQAVKEKDPCPDEERSEQETQAESPSGDPDRYDVWDGVPGC